MPQQDAPRTGDRHQQAHTQPALPTPRDQATDRSRSKRPSTCSQLQEWFMDYSSSDWASYEWSTAHFARMFPSRSKPGKALRQYAADRVDDPATTLPLLAVAAQRLAAWDRSEYRAVARSALKKTSHPQARRLIALCALNAGESRRTVTAWLRQERENDLTLRVLEDRNFTVLNPTDAFS